MVFLLLFLFLCLGVIETIYLLEYLAPEHMSSLQLPVWLQPEVKDTSALLFLMLIKHLMLISTRY